MKREISLQPGKPSAKEEIRRLMRSRLGDMKPALRTEASLRICLAAAHLPAFQQARCVALFSPLPSEPDVCLLIEEAWAQGKRIALPLMIKHGTTPKLDWHEVTSWDDVVVPGPFGLREPDPLSCPHLIHAELDCAFIPGLAFDAHGMRLGRGGGFYDRFLDQASNDLPRIGLMFSCQQVPSVPHEPHDQALPSLLTEEKLWIFPQVDGLSS